MKTAHQRTAAWLQASGVKQDRAAQSLQLGCDLEEVAEALECMRVDSDGWQRVLERAAIDLRDLAREVQSGKRTAHVPNHLRPGFLKELIDREVTASAICYAHGWDKDGAIEAVVASNEDKLVDGKPVIKPGGKLGKPAGWKAPDMKGFV